MKLVVVTTDLEKCLFIYMCAICTYSTFWVNPWYFKKFEKYSCHAGR